MQKKTTYTMKSLPKEERPYEKCQRLGPEALTDAELVSIILRTGTTRESALDLAKRILDQPGFKGLTGLYHLSFRQLTGIYGIGRVKAAELKCVCELSRRIASSSRTPTTAFSSPAQVADYFMELLRHEERENVLLVLLNSAGRMLGWERIAQGSSSGAPVSPKEIFQLALSYHASGIVLLHNHPGGDPSPSQEDLAVTRRISEAGEMMGIILLDHIIIGDRIYFSFQEANLL